MLKPILHFSGHTLRTLIEILLGVCVAISLLFGLALWKFSQGPVDVSWAVPYVERAITDGNKSINVKMGSVVAEMPELTGALSLGISNFELYSDAKKIIDVEKVGLRLSKAALLIGQIAPEAIIIDNPSLKIMRSHQGEFQIALQDSHQQENAAPNFENLPLKKFAESLFLNDSFFAQSPLGLWNGLEVLSLKNADLITEDHLSGVTWPLSAVDIELLRSKQNFKVGLKWPQKRGVNEFSELNLHVQRIRDQKKSIVLNLGLLDVSLLAKIFSTLSVFTETELVLNGNIKGALDKDWMIENLNGAIGATDFEGSLFSVNAKRIGNELPLVLSLQSLSFDQIQNVWPKGLEEYNITEWMTKRLQKGTLSDISIALPFQKNDKIWELKNPRVTFAFEGANVNYFDPLPPVLNGTGIAKIENDALRITIGSGTLGGMNLKGGAIELTNLSKPIPSMLNIQADISSKLPNILNYIYTDPISLKDSVGLNPAEVRGDADVKLILSMPADENVKIEEIKVDVEGTIKGAFVPKLVRGMDLMGENFNVSVRNNEFKLEGIGALNGRRGKFSYKEFLDSQTALYKADIEAEIETDAELRQKFGVNLEQFVEGVVPVKINYRQEKDLSAKIDIEANLNNAVVNFAPLHYQKPAGQNGTALAQAFLNKNEEIEKIENLKIQIGNDNAEGNIQFGKVGSLWDIKSGAFNTVKLGLNEFNVNFKQLALNQFDVNVKAKTIDARPYLGNTDKQTQAKNKNSETGVAANINLESPILRTGDLPEQSLRSANLQLRVDGAGDIRFMDLKAALRDGSPVQLSIKPQSNGRLNMNVSSNNAGLFLRTLGLYETMQGGIFNLSATSFAPSQPNNFRGVAEISNFKIVKAPVLAQLIGAFSLSGLGNLLNNEGMDFKKLRSDFDWADTPMGRMIGLRNGKVSGNSVSLTFGGTINQEKNNMQISGTFVPAADINKFVSKIPIVGELLTGGKDGGIIAATYAVKGKADKPEVIINPLSVLTPGFLRTILFEGGGKSANTSKNKSQQKRGYN